MMYDEMLRKIKKIFCINMCCYWETVVSWLRGAMEHEIKRLRQMSYDFGRHAEWLENTIKCTRRRVKGKAKDELSEAHNSLKKLCEQFENDVSIDVDFSSLRRECDVIFLQVLKHMTI